MEHRQHCKYCGGWYPDIGRHYFQLDFWEQERHKNVLKYEEPELREWLESVTEIVTGKRIASLLNPLVEKRADEKEASAASV